MMNTSYAPTGLFLMLARPPRAYARGYHLSPHPGLRSREGQFRDERFPLRLESIHIVLIENLFQGIKPAWILLLIGHKLLVKIDQQPALLEVIAQVSRLRVIGTAVFVVKLRAGHRRQLLERRHAPRLDRSLQPRQSPVGHPHDMPVALIA